ncbi:MAG: small ribosomal subunit biogenesis GTPase RsgA [Gammaproteobacteria bacterium]|jgi:ribosome biogenesis GTPase|nr:small ribosomal subunit biogenesis GTPase RsgA [Gammaproteobacteria bacterium]
MGRRLTDQQRARIAAIQVTRRERMEARASRELAAATGDAPLPGRVVVRHGQNLLVEDASGALHHCLFRQNLGDVVCGDRVAWQATGPSAGVVTARLERTAALARPDYSGREKPLAANLTQLVVVIAPRPEPNEYLVDQYLVAAELIGVAALIAVNKVDLVDGPAREALRARFAHYAAIGYPLVEVSARRAHGLEPLAARLRGETSVLVGQSGVGKSSLVNALLPDRDAQTGHLSDATGHGRHTTSAATLYHLPDGGDLIDSPGVRSFRLAHIERRQLEAGFRELRPLIGHCQFRDCTHDHEPGCAIKAAVEAGAVSPRRLANFLHLAAGLPTAY